MFLTMAFTMNSFADGRGMLETSPLEENYGVQIVFSKSSPDIFSFASSGYGKVASLKDIDFMLYGSLKYTWTYFEGFDSEGKFLFSSVPYEFSGGFGTMLTYRFAYILFSLEPRYWKIDYFTERGEDELKQFSMGLFIETGVYMKGASIRVAYSGLFDGLFDSPHVESYAGYELTTNLIRVNPIASVRYSFDEGFKGLSRLSLGVAARGMRKSFMPAWLGFFAGYNLAGLNSGPIVSISAFKGKLNTMLELYYGTVTGGINFSIGLSYALE